MIIEKGPMKFLLWGIYTEHIYTHTCVHIKIFFKEIITFIE